MTFEIRPRRQSARVARSQVAVRLGLAVYAGLCAAILLRVMVLALTFPSSVPSVSAILAVTDPIILPLTLLPGADRGIVGALSLADATAAISLMAAPLPFLGRRARSG
jgi:hypothetical protein